MKILYQCEQCNKIFGLEADCRVCEVLHREPKAVKLSDGSTMAYKLSAEMV